MTTRHVTLNDIQQILMNNIEAKNEKQNEFFSFKSQLSLYLIGKNIKLQ